MAAYAALVSLMHIIEQLQHHPHPPFYLDNKHAQCLIEKVTFLQDFLEVYSHVSNEQVDHLQSRIAEAAYKAQDVIETHVVDQIHAQSTTYGEQNSSVDFYRDLQTVIQDMDFFKNEVIEIKEKMGPSRNIQQHNRSSTSAAGLSGSSSMGQTDMVGRDDVLNEIMDQLLWRQQSCQVIPIVGMGGIGKTTLARNVYENPFIVRHFDFHTWITISQEYNCREILLEILCQNNQDGLESLSRESEAKLGERVYKKLWHRRYLIIMDDMWSVEAWENLKLFFPENNNGSGVIITSRLSNVARHIRGACVIEMSFLNEDKSWNLLCKSVFGKDSCPLEFEETGRRIAENCKGLPLSISVIGGLLAKSEQTLEYWKYIAENINSTVNLEENELCLNLLYMSYNYLPIHLKPCFLYMGILSEDENIRASELIKLWVAEGFIKPVSGKSLEEVAQESLKALVDRNLILVDKWKRNGKIKFCKIHDLLRDLCLREAMKDKFLYVTRPESHRYCPWDMNSQRRIAIHRRTLWNEKDEYYLHEFRDALQSAPLARSLIFVSLKILPSCNSRLSRVLKAFDSRSGENHSIESPFQLVNLRYLAITAHWIQFLFHTIPSSVYLLWNLQTLIVNHIPTSNVDIWKLPLLRHVKLVRLYLHYPEQHDFVLGNLQTLSRIENFKCGEEVVKRIPNIQKLEIFYTIHPLTASYYHLNNLCRLNKLESLNFSFLSMLSSGDLVQNLTFPHSLKKLILQGCNLHWQDMSTMIGSLPHLEVLKLGWDSFIGPEWETLEGQFLSLKFLTIRCKELECWTTGASHFPRLEHLVLDHLGRLKEIPLDLGNIPTLKLIEIDGCSSAVVFSAKEIAEEQIDFGNEDLQVQARDAYDMPYEELMSMASHNFLVDISELNLLSNMPSQDV